MKYIGKNSISFFMKILLSIFMITTIALLAFLPWIINQFLGITYGIGNTFAKTILLIVLYPSGICGLLIENELRRIFKSLEKKDPFVDSNIKSLNSMGIYMIVVFVMFIFKIFTLNSIMTMVCALAFVIISLLCFVLADVFKQAVIYKKDNDLTI